ncbi:MAG: hypothetical protein EU548_06885, partial [Promethearchaeota archaeon]
MKLIIKKLSLLFLFLSLPITVLMNSLLVDTTTYSNFQELNENKPKEIEINKDLRELLNDPSQQDLTATLIVKINQEYYKQGLQSIHSIVGLKVEKYFNSFSMIQVSGRIGCLNELRKITYIEGIYLDAPQSVEREDNLYNTLKYSGFSEDIANVSDIIDSENVAKSLNTNKSDKGKEVVIAVLDSGIDIPGQIGGDLDDFDDNSSTLLDVKLYGAVSMVPYEPLYYTDFRGSGTYHAGVASGTGGRNSSFVGVAPESFILNVKVVDSVGLTYYTCVISGLEWALSHDADILCIPWEFPGLYNDPLSTAINKVVEKGAIVIAPAGDNGPAYTTPLTPGQSLGAITVGAYDHLQDSVAEFSGRGPTYDLRSTPDLLAPGMNVVGPRVILEPDLEGIEEGGIDLGIFSNFNSSLPDFDVEIPIFGTPIDENYTMLSSTTSATAVVAGACAILVSLYPLANPELIKISLMKTATPPLEQTNVAGFGLINVTAAALWLNSYLSTNTSIGLRIPQLTIYPGFLINADHRGITGDITQPEVWDPYDIYAMTSTQAMISAMAITNSSDTANFTKMDLHLPLNQFALSFNDTGYLFSELEVYRELGNITDYAGYDDADYCRWAGVLGLFEELFVVVIIETWGYTYDGYILSTQPNYTSRMTGFKFSFNILNIGPKTFNNLSLHSYFKADLYMNEYNITDPYNFAGSLNASYDDRIYYEPSIQAIYCIDNYTEGEEATNESTCFGFKSTSHSLSKWEINSSDTLFFDLVNHSYQWSNQSEFNMEIQKDWGFIQSWNLTSQLGPHSRVNFTGILSIGKSNSSERCINHMKQVFHKMQTNVTHPSITDLAIIMTRTPRMGEIYEPFSSTSYIINLGNTYIDSTEFWFVANFSTGPEETTLFTSIKNIKNWNPMEIRTVKNSWIPDTEGSYSLAWIIGGYEVIFFEQDDSLLNNYQGRTIFIYDYQQLRPHIRDLIILSPEQFPIDPFILEYPGDFALVNITLISPIRLSSFDLTVTGHQPSMVILDQKKFYDLERHSIIPMSIIVPMFYKEGLYLLNLNCYPNSQTNPLIIPIQFRLENYKGRIMFDGIHNKVIPDFKTLNVSQFGLKIDTLLEERLDYIFGNF